MRRTIALSGLTMMLAVPCIGPAAAFDEVSGSGWRKSYAPRHERPGRVYGAQADGSVSGREPVYFVGHGGGSPNALFGYDGVPDPNPVPVTVVEYREPYIGSGLLYNVPPTVAYGSVRAIRARY